MEEKKYKFRPSARIMTTIGEEIIRDIYAAVIELVKNSYDADATEVEVVIIKLNESKVKLSIVDNGHGMTRKAIEDKWLVPATGDKSFRKRSPGGRIMQGKKGIGRFSAAILGDELLLTSTSNKVTTSIDINWDKFKVREYLDEIEIEISSSKSNKNDGTSFEIIAGGDKANQWSNVQFEHLIKDLRKLITPIIEKDIIDDFNINLKIQGFEGDYECYESVIQSFELLDYYDYRLSGRVFGDGQYKIKYQNKQLDIEEIKIDKITLTSNKAYCGEVSFDFRIFDRDVDSIKKLSDTINNKKNETKRILDSISGVSIYRNGFRIRPYGDSGNDWLELDKKRISAPTRKIGSNQISGYIEIGDEETSNLIETSARDGLKEDKHYFGLRTIFNELITIVELKRYAFRKKTGKGRKTSLINIQLEDITDISNVKDKVKDTLEKHNVSKAEIEEVDKYIENDTRSKVLIAKDIERKILMYQGQATLGNIVNRVLHETSKPISFLRNQNAALNRAYTRYQKSKSHEVLDKIIRIIEEYPEQVEILSDFIKRLKPLATKPKYKIEKIYAKNILESCVKVFECEIYAKNIILDLNCGKDISFNAIRVDIIGAITNVLDNAIHWVAYKKSNRKIIIDVTQLNKEIQISIWNNGPKIMPEMMEERNLFEPGITGKEDGTGLGLAIAGEALKRNNGTISVRNDNTDGACFDIIILSEGTNGNE